MKKFHSIIIVLLMSIVLFSCEKDKVDPTPPPVISQPSLGETSFIELISNKKWWTDSVGKVSSTTSSLIGFNVAFKNPVYNSSTKKWTGDTYQFSNTVSTPFISSYEATYVIDYNNTTLHYNNTDYRIISCNNLKLRLKRISNGDTLVYSNKGTF